MGDLELFSTPLCPFAHRVRLALSAKSLTCRLTEIDLRNKPQSLLEISPLGRIPALRHDQTHVCESAVICEYPDEVNAEPPQFHLDRYARLQAQRAAQELAS